MSKKCPEEENWVYQVLNQCVKIHGKSQMSDKVVQFVGLVASDVLPV